MTLRIDQRDLGKLALDRSSGTAPLSNAQVTAVRAALRGNGTIVAVVNAGRRWPLSDRGASAVLLKMDAFQSRLGTRGALVRKGDHDQTKVLPAVPAPQVRAVDLPQRRPAMRASAHCPRCFRPCAPACRQ